MHYKIYSKQMLIVSKWIYNSTYILPILFFYIINFNLKIRSLILEEKNL